MPSRSTNLLAGKASLSSASSATGNTILPKAKSTVLPPLPGQESGDEESAQRIADSLKRKSPLVESGSSGAAKESRRQKKARRLASNMEGGAARSADAEMPKEEPLNEDIARMDRQLTADYFARQTKRFEPDISLDELENRRVAGVQPLQKKHMPSDRLTTFVVSTFLDTSDFGEARKLASLPAFLEHYSDRTRAQLSQVPEPNGAPHTIVVAASGIRAADLVRTLRVFQTKDAMVAKLFAKHIKLKEAVESAKKSR